MIILVMGVAGAGKTTVGHALADRLGFRFIDADDLHPPENVAKMRQGLPLDDADRAPWLEAVSAQLHGDVVLACSALKERYRARLMPTLVVWLRVPRAELERRLAARTGHFFPPSLLQTQLDELEEPANALAVDASRPVAEVVSRLDEAVRRRSFVDSPHAP